MSDAIAALAKRFWSVHPNEIHPSITREQFYAQEMRALFATQANRIEVLEARLDRAVTRGLEQVEQIATLEAENANLRHWKALENPLTAAMTIANSHLAPLHTRIATLEAALREIKDQYLTPDQSSAIARKALDQSSPPSATE